MKKLVALLIALSMASYACYNTYYVTMDQLKELQSAESGESKIVDTEEGEKVEVEVATRLFVRDTDRRKYPITPYNFKLTSSQLVASDRDYIFMLNQLQHRGEIELLSTAKTVLLISGAALAVAGVIVAVIYTAGASRFEAK